MPSSSKEVAEDVAKSLSIIVRWSRARLFDKVIVRAGVTMDRSAFAILGMLAQHRVLRTAELASLLGLDRSTVSRQVAAVVANGWVKREGDESDGRAALLSLTRHGRGVHKRLADAWRQLCFELVDDWDPHDQAEMARLLGNLARRIEEDQPR